MVGNPENILVEYDYQNIIIVDPNKIVDTEGNVKERQIAHENLVFYASLECELLPRTRLAVGTDNLSEIQNVTLSKVNFLAPAGEQFLKNTFYDEFTGGGINVQKSTFESSVNSEGQTVVFEKQTTENNYDTGLLGMRSINVSVNSAGFSEVVVVLEDIRGRALFEKGEQSPYAAFFNLPYPIFYLTLKGYLGQAIRYQLSLLSFNASFDTNSGNYNINLKFIAYKYNVLTAINIAHLFATPYMYNVKYDERPNPIEPAQQNVQTEVINQIPSSKGLGKIQEVYSEYKSKNLVDQNLPEITLRQLVARLERLEKYILQSFGQEELGYVTDYDTYVNQLRKFRGEVYFFGNSWEKTYLNTKNYFINTDGKKVYKFNKEIIDNKKQLEALSNLNSIISANTQSLNSNKTFGKDGEYKVSGGEGGKSNINVDIKVSNVRLENFDFSQIDIDETYRIRNKKALVPDEKPAFIQKLSLEFSGDTLSEGGKQDTFFFQFEGKERFVDITNQITNTLKQKSEEIDEKISAALATQIQKKDNGLGFRPTIRNICGVLMANAEAFLRLMNDTHKKAWDVRDNEDRREAVLGQTTVINPDDVPGNPIYPWPQFFIETNNEKGEKYELRYPGENDIINSTKGYDYELWPEVQFVEEYLNGLSQTTDTILDPGPIASDVGVINRISLNSLDYYTSNIIFTNKEEVKFFYEIYERIFLSSFFQRFNKKFAEESQLTQVVSESEIINLKNALGNSSPYLISKIKQYALSASGYKTFLATISNDGTGESWQKFIRDEFVTPYIREEVDKSFELFFSLNNTGDKSVQPEPKNIDKLNQFLQSTKTNETDITDTYPFTIPNWFKTNLANGNSSNQKDIYSTTKVLSFNPNFKMIANYTQESNYNIKRPITSFKKTKPDVQNNVGIKSFYENRQIKDFVPTEGYLYYQNYFGDVTKKQTTSILNTPYFHLAIADGVSGIKLGKKSPFVAAAYLFLNSLPLATLREKYKTFEGGNEIDLDYIFATLKKFGAIHKVPYAWILKYGSIWHRYKKYVEDGVDIIQDVWNNFDYKFFYDPITLNPQKQYTVSAGTQVTDIVLEQITNVAGNELLEMNLGFYPRLISDYNYLIKGVDLFTFYDNQELNDNLASGYTLNVCTESQINKPIGYNPSATTQSLRITPWVSTLKDTINKKEYVIPCFGSNLNQLNFELFKPSGELIVSPYSNPAVFNGSVRGFLKCSNFGYYDNSQIDKPDTDKYLKTIFSGESQQEPFSLNKQNGYINFEELFGVFNKSILDLFEKEFLKFCTNETEYVTETPETEQGSANLSNNKLVSESTPQFKNFQLLMKKILEIDETPFTNSKDYINQISEKQYNQLNSVIDNFLKFDVTFKYGNPSDYNRRLFDSYSTVNPVVDPISFGPYIPNTLPGDNATLAQSEQFYPDAWKALKIYVGDPDIPGMEYTNAGSTITDFFIDNNIEFSPQSVATLYPLVKIYATQKKINTPYNKNTFTTSLNNFYQENQTVFNQTLDAFLLGARKNLPNIEEVSEGYIEPSVVGEQIRRELWETFKAFNDSWIAGTDYSQTLLFEDLLFLDRANRDVGDEIIVDPFTIKNLLSKKMNLSASTYSYLMSVLEKHHFVTMMLPAYVNYYNIIDGTNGAEAFVDSTTEFGNNLFGTFLNVDTRKSTPKMVARYAEPGSKYLKPTENDKNIRFKSDSFDMIKASECPLVDKLNGKTDWSKSNRVVGFNVDIGVRNQNVFKNFSVSQELGKQTTESLVSLDTAVNQSSGRNSTTQNVSLYNFYKNRSYNCSVECLGNAMIQPTMYFNLRHVPMFTGPYMIMSVKHTISPAGFQTNFTGIRQGILSLPKVKNYMMSVTKDILQSLKEKKRQATKNLSKPEVSNDVSELQEGYNKSKQELDNSATGCTSSLVPDYSTFVRLNGKSTEAQLAQSNNNFQNNLSTAQLVEKIKQKSSTNKTKFMIFTLCYLESYNENGKQFQAFNNNFSGVKLNRKWPPTLVSSFVENYYSCQNQTDGTTSPYAVFTGDKFFDFMAGYITESKLSNITAINEEEFVEFYFKNWIQVSASPTAYDLFEQTDQYQIIYKKVENAFELGRNSNL